MASGKNLHRKLIFHYNSDSQMNHIHNIQWSVFIPPAFLLPLGLDSNVIVKNTQKLVF
jgi:hypothetical protein